MRIFRLWDWLFPLHFYQTNVAAAVVGSAAVGAVGSSMAAKKAAGAQTAGAAAANSLTQEQFNQTREDNRPFLLNGVNSSNRLAALMGTMDDGPSKSVEDFFQSVRQNHYKFGHVSGKKYLLAEPALAEAKRLYAEQEERKKMVAAAKASGDYGSLMRNFGQQDLDNDVIYQNGFQFALDEGRKGLERQAAATGGTQNGKTLKALTRFGAQTANQWGGDAFNRFNTNKLNTYNMLSGQAGAGQVAVNNVSTAGANAAQSMGNNLIGMGNARAASATGTANGINNALSGGINAWQQNRLYDSMTFNPSTPGYGGYNEQMAYMNNQLG